VTSLRLLLDFFAPEVIRGLLQIEQRKDGQSSYRDLKIGAADFNAEGKVPFGRNTSFIGAPVSSSQER